MNQALDFAVEIISSTGWLAIIAGIVVFAMLGRARLPSKLTYGLAIVLSLVYAVVSTKGTGAEFGTDEQLLLSRSIAALAYATFLAVVYWLSRAKFRVAASASVKKSAARAKARKPGYHGKTARFA